VQEGQSFLYIACELTTYWIDDGESADSAMIVLALPPELAIVQ
jgi:hypothetical protein